MQQGNLSEVEEKAGSYEQSKMKSVIKAMRLGKMLTGIASEPNHVPVNEIPKLDGTKREERIDDESR